MGENIIDLMNNINKSDTNITEIFEDDFLNYIDITPWIVGTYYCVLVIGVLINLCLIISLLQQKKHGTTYLILQFAAIDIISASVGAAEVSSLYTQDWKLHFNLCPLFLGTEVLINVLTVYMHILLNFHAISSWNMQKNVEMSNKNPLTSDVDESNECLVFSENLVVNRTLNIDYRHKRTSVSIIVPSILLWFSCLSLSIPEYTLSTTVEYHANQTLCTIVDLHYTQLFQYMLIAFRGIIPLPLLLLTFIVVIFKLCNSNSLSNVKKNSSAKKFNELRNLLLLSIVLSLLYTVSSIQRSVIHFLHIISQQFGKTTLKKFKMPPLDNFFVTHYTNMSLSMIHYSSIVLRPVLCIITMPSTIATLRNCIFRVNEKKNSN